MAFNRTIVPAMRHQRPSDAGIKIIEARISIHAVRSVAIRMKTLRIDQRSPAARQAQDIGLLTLVWISMIVVARPTGNFPINDDWVYAATVQSLLDRGRFDIFASSANLGPQALWGWAIAKILGFSFEHLRSTTQFLGLAGAVTTYLLYSEVWTDRLGAFILATTLSVSPLYFALANTFMTDVPFFTLELISLYLLCLGTMRGRRQFTIAGLALAITTVLLRQFAIAVLVGYAVATLSARKSSIKNVTLSVLPLIIGLILNWVFTTWLLETNRKAGGGNNVSLFHLSASAVLAQVRSLALQFSSYAGLLLIPFIVFLLPLGPSQGRRKSLWIAIAVVALAIGSFYWDRRLVVPIGENVLAWFGIGPLIDRDVFIQRVNLPVESTVVRAGWVVVTIMTVIASATIVVSLSRGLVALLRNPCVTDLIQWRKREVSLLIATTVLGYLLILVVALGEFPLFERYLLLPIGLVSFAMPLLRQGETSGPRLTRYRALAALLLLVPVAMFSVISTHDFFVWDRVRWTAIGDLTSSGVQLSRVDAGYEFAGRYQYDPHYPGVAGKSWWWIIDDEFQIASGPLDGYIVLKQYPVKRWWQNGSHDVFILKRGSASP